MEPPVPSVPSGIGHPMELPVPGVYFPQATITNLTDDHDIGTALPMPPTNGTSGSGESAARWRQRAAEATDPCGPAQSISGVEVEESDEEKAEESDEE